MTLPLPMSDHTADAEEIQTTTMHATIPIPEIEVSGLATCPEKAVASLCEWQEDDRQQTDGDVQTPSRTDAEPPDFTSLAGTGGGIGESDSATSAILTAGLKSNMEMSAIDDYFFVLRDARFRRRATAPQIRLETGTAPAYDGFTLTESPDC